jgi:hypothetical protein
MKGVPVTLEGIDTDINSKDDEELSLKSCLTNMPGSCRKMVIAGPAPPGLVIEANLEEFVWTILANSGAHVVGISVTKCTSKKTFASFVHHL